MLQLENVSSGYGQTQVLFQVTLEVNPGEIVCLLGANAAGKTTTMKTILGSVKPQAGTIHFEGKRIDGLRTHSIVRLGISHVPEGRRIFPGLTVKENIMLGAEPAR